MTYFPPVPEALVPAMPECRHLPEGVCDHCAAELTDTPAPLIVAAVELRAWARASQLLAEREGFARTAAAVASYVDLIELAMRSGAHSFELRPIPTHTRIEAP